MSDDWPPHEEGHYVRHRDDGVTETAWVRRFPKITEAEIRAALEYARTMPPLGGTPGEGET